MALAAVVILTAPRYAPVIAPKTRPSGIITGRKIRCRAGTKGIRAAPAKSPRKSAIVNGSSGSDLVRTPLRLQKTPAPRTYQRPRPGYPDNEGFSSWSDFAERCTLSLLSAPHEARSASPEGATIVLDSGLTPKDSAG